MSVASLRGRKYRRCGRQRLRRWPGPSRARRLAFVAQLAPARLYFVPQQAGQHEAGRYPSPSWTRRSVSCRPGARRRRAGLRQAAVMRQHGVQHREDTARQPGAFERRQAGQRMAGLQQFDHLVEQARRGHIGQQGAPTRAPGAVLASRSKPSLAAKRAARMMRTGLRGSGSGSPIMQHLWLAARRPGCRGSPPPSGERARSTWR